MVGLGDLPGGTFRSEANGVSSDGSVVVGLSDTSDGLEAFRWTSEKGMVGLGKLLGRDFSEAKDVSADGSVITGDGWSTIGREAFVWTEESGMIGLGFLGDLGFASSGYGVSDDGKIVVGSSTIGNAQKEAFLWTEELGMLGLGDFPGGLHRSEAWGVSADGTVVVGYAVSDTTWEAVHWTVGPDMDGLGSMPVGLGILPGGNYSNARDVSADGSVIVGISASSDGEQAYRWTAETEMVPLGDLPGGDFFSVATGVSADGSVVTGYSESEHGTEAFIWTEQTGMVAIGDLAGGSISSRASSISGDGSVIVGRSSSSNGQEAFRWTGNVADVIVDSLIVSTNPTDGVEFSYKISDADLPVATTVNVYWAGGDRFEDAIGSPVFSQVTSTAQDDYGPITVPAANLIDPPLEATHLIVVADPPQTERQDGLISESNEGNNLLSLSLLTVANTQDDGIGSLRFALNIANGNAGLDTIAFDIPGDGPHTIQTLSTLPVVTDPVVIDGTSQSGYSNSAEIELDGSMAPAGTDGLTLAGNGGSTVKGLHVGKFSGDGIVLRSDGNILQRNEVGIVIGGEGRGNGGYGVRIDDGSDNTIGMNPDDEDSDGNVLAFNALGGIVVGGSSQNNLIRGNVITDNGGLGIDLVDPKFGEGRITPNDEGDADSGPNGLQNYPVITRIENGDVTRLVGFIESTPNTDVYFDFYTSDVSTATNAESIMQGNSHLYGVQGRVGPTGRAEFDFTIERPTRKDDFISATATKLTGGKSTSEFSPFPLVVNIATHGFNPVPPLLEIASGSFDTDATEWQAFRQEWNRLAKALSEIPNPGTVLADRVVSSVSEWDSSRGFLAGFASLFLAKTAEAAAEITADADAKSKFLNRFEALKIGASTFQRISSRLAVAAAQRIAGEVETYLLPPGLSRQFQRIHLVGHSRGAAVNARISKILDSKYVVDQYTSLDGYSIDWPSNGGLIGDIDIADEATAETKINYRVQRDIANFVVDEVEGVIQMPKLASMIKNVVEILGGVLPDELIHLLGDDKEIRDILRENSLLAPGRFGFDSNEIIMGVGEGETARSNHVNITKLFIESEDNGNEILCNYVGKNRDVSIAAELAPLEASDFDGGMCQVAAFRSRNQVTERVETSSAATNDDFTDGSFEELGDFVTEVRRADSTPTGLQVVDQWYEIVTDPLFLFSSQWNATGDARLVEEESNFLAELKQSDDTSMGQLLVFEKSPNGVLFDLEVLDAGADDRLVIAYNDTVLQSIDLVSVESESRQSVSLAGIAPSSGELTFRIVGPLTTPATVRLDNITTQVDTDLDGVPDAIEDGAANGGDGNNDGTPDRQQAHIASLRNPDNGNYVTIAAPDAQNLSAVQVMPSPDVMPPEDLDFRIGQLQYQVQTGNSEETIITIFTDTLNAFNAYYMYGPTLENSSPRFYRFLFDGQTGAELVGDRIVVHYRDGQRGDSDLMSDGTITVLGAPVMNTSDFLHRNPVNQFDVNDDARVSALDALNVINELARSDGPRDLPLRPPLEFQPFLDPNGDDRVSALDALVIINQLARVTLQADGEQLVMRREQSSLTAVLGHHVSFASRREKSVYSYDEQTELGAVPIWNLKNGLAAPPSETESLPHTSETNILNRLQHWLTSAFVDDYFEELGCPSLETNRS